MSSIPTLPIELERHIFEIAILIHPWSAAVLILVARRVQIWIEPLLYKVLRICPTPRKHMEIQIPVERICGLIKSKPASFFHDHVRHISLYGENHIDDIIPLFAVCDAVLDISLSIASGASILLPSLGALPLQRLTANLTFLFPGPSGPDFGHPIFTNITHLALYGHPGHGWDTWSGLAQIPGLTHLSFHNYGIDLPICHGALLHCKALEVLANVFPSKDYLNPFPDYVTVTADPRFVVLVVPDFIMIGDWEVGAWGGADCWVRASELVRKRRSGQVKEYAFGYDN
ncbi:hypothetical protein C8R44DRAFT_760013 [Mycena epipterygia]|nr:hypothetical protein C8R44DRAFT_760013 [Mycena epipterygia]